MARQADVNNTMGFTVPDLMGIDVEKVGPFKQALQDYYNALIDAIHKIGSADKSEVKPLIEQGIRGESARNTMEIKVMYIAAKCETYCFGLRDLVNAIDNLIASYEKQDQNK